MYVGAIGIVVGLRFDVFLCVGCNETATTEIYTLFLYGSSDLDGGEDEWSCSVRSAAVVVVVVVEVVVEVVGVVVVVVVAAVAEAVVVAVAAVAVVAVVADLLHFQVSLLLPLS